MTEDVLSQGELDLLLNAIGSGEAEPDNAHETVERKNIRIWDFRRPDKFSKEHYRTVSFMHETFARLATTSLAAQLRSMVHIEVASVDQLTYEEFLRSIPAPTALAVVNMDPLVGSAILELDPVITFTIIDRLMGGPGEGLKFNREISEIERAVMESVIVHILGNLREAWSQVVDLRPRLSQIDTNPQFVQIVPPTEMVLLVTMETKVEKTEGMMNLCIPYLTIEPIISRLSVQYWYASDRRRDGESESINLLMKRLEKVDIPVVTEIGKIDMPVRDVVSLKVGDIVNLTGTPISAPLTLKLGNRPKFECRPGITGKNYAVQVTRQLEAVDELEFEPFIEEGDEE